MEDEILFRILKEDKEMNEINFNRLKTANEFKKRELLTQDGDLFLTIDSLITLNNYITNSDNLLLRQIDVKPALCNKQYMDFSKIESELYNLVDQFNDRYISNRQFCKKFLDDIHPFADGNGRTCKILFYR